MTELVSYRTLGRSGLRVSPLTLGGMTFGDSTWGCDQATSYDIMDRFIDAGGNMIDTSNGYNEGASEEIIGSYFRDRPGRRDRIVLSTKFASNAHPGDPNGGGGGRKAIVQQLNASLKRLQTDYIDLYWQHHWDQHTPIDETMSTLDDLVSAGKILYIGISDTPAWAVARAATIADLRGWSPVIALQLEYSLLQRTVEGEQFGVARAFGLGVTPFSPIGGGLLSGKFSRNDPEPCTSGRTKFLSPSLNEGAFDIIELVSDVAHELGTTPASVALAWVRQRPEITSTLIGARRVDQLDENIASLAVELPPEAVQRLDDATTPALDFPADFLERIAISRQQGGTTINGVSSIAFRNPFTKQE
jgi:aryl-alcohol dehydrogenase-like predicted oxidoreductase